MVRSHDVRPAPIRQLHHTFKRTRPLSHAWWCQSLWQPAWWPRHTVSELIRLSINNTTGLLKLGPLRFRASGRSRWTRPVSYWEERHCKWCCVVYFGSYLAQWREETQRPLTDDLLQAHVIIWRSDDVRSGLPGFREYSQNAPTCIFIFIFIYNKYTHTRIYIYVWPD